MTRWAFAAMLVVGSAAQAEIALESGRSMLVEAKLGPYTPLIDRHFTDTPGPYQTVFGAPMLLGELEVEYQFFQKLGSLSAGLSVGYAEKFSPSRDAVTGTKVSQSTGLRVVPLKALVVYRFDWLALKQDIPLVPYAKAGLVGTSWWSTNGPDIEVADGLRGAGFTWGFSGTLGVSLLLDFLDPRLARDFDTGMGVNHTYLFGEFTFQEVTNFGLRAATDLDFSSRHWIFGLALEF